MNARASARDTLLELMKTEMAAFLPARAVQRSLDDVARIKLADLEKGVLCIVAGGGGQFGNWQGREGELGTVRGTIVGYVQVGEKELPQETERAEFALLEDVLRWFGERHSEPLGSTYPLDYKQSGQMEHPIGWFALQFELRFV